MSENMRLNTEPRRGNCAENLSFSLVVDVSFDMGVLAEEFLCCSDYVHVSLFWVKKVFGA